jgi:DNA processing protein
MEPGIKNSELLYQLALTLVPNIGDVHAKILIQHYGQASDVFRSNQSLLEKIEGIGVIRARSIKRFIDYTIAEKEIAFIEKYNIQPLFITDKNYPQRLLNCYDPPALLFYRGSADLNTSKVLAIVGTRSNTDYGKQFTEEMIKALSEEKILIVSGLAFGIDGIAHKAAIKNDLPTVGVVGHGLDTIYPEHHTSLAKDMVRHGGGILTQFRSKTQPDKHNFPIRNRIVAGMCDATIVVESGIKGGSLITAELANGYNRDVFAVPGKTIDNKSTGCNYLIKSNKAMLLTSASEVLEIMGWQESTKQKRRRQKELFIALSPDEKIILDILNIKDLAHIDEINIQSGLSTSKVAAAILNLELQGVIISLPGKLYKLA